MDESSIRIRKSFALNELQDPFDMDLGKPAEVETNRSDIEEDTNSATSKKTLQHKSRT